jgi:adhesin transport system outer membrane protein
VIEAAAGVATVPDDRSKLTVSLADTVPATALDRKNSALSATMSLGEAVHSAVSDNALIGVGEGRVDEALAGIGLSRSAFFPQVDISADSGSSTLGKYSDDQGGAPYFSGGKTDLSSRSDLTLGGRQLIYDFGATSHDVARASAVKDAESFNLRDQTEDVAQKVSNAYLHILEQRALIAIANMHVEALEQLLRILGENEREGNAAMADIKRVRARLIDAQAQRADAQSELQSASDRFRRLVHVEPGQLSRAPTFSSAIPTSVEAALAQAQQGNPRLQAAEAFFRSARLELESQTASTLPKLQLESQLTGTHFASGDNRTELDGRVMMALRYKILDGGLQSSQSQQLRAKVVQAELRWRDGREEVEADLRQSYHSLVTARAKSAHLRQGVSDAGKAKDLYDEQYRGGKRSLLELLDVQAAYFQAQAAEITNRFDENRAAYAILRDLGRLTSTTLASR